MSTPALRLLFGWELPDSCLGQNSRHKVIVSAAISECRPATTVTRFRYSIRARQCFRELMLNSNLAARPELLVDQCNPGTPSSTSVFDTIWSPASASMKVKLAPP